MERIHRRLRDPEFRVPEEYPPIPAEQAVPIESRAVPEPAVAPEHPPLGDEFNDSSSEPDKETTRRTRRSDRRGSARDRRRRSLLLQSAAVITAVVITNDALGIDILYHDPLISDLHSHYGDYWDEPRGDPWSDAEQADYYFPSLPNREPNGEVPGVGVLNEEYVRLEPGEARDQQYLWAGSAYGLWDENGDWQAVALSQVEGASYDRGSNVLTLTNFSGPVLNVNMMGNGFTVKLVGENRLDAILVWGFSYGGSVTFTGDGSLTVNEDRRFEIGLELRAEYSQSAVMVEPGVSLDIYGAKAAVLVEDTYDEKGFYYLTPLTMTGGTRYTEISSASADPPPVAAGVRTDDGFEASHITIR